MAKSFLNEKSKKKIKEKRFYIVLACCVVSLSVIGIFANNPPVENAPAENKNSLVPYSLPEPMENESESTPEKVLPPEEEYDFPPEQTPPPEPDEEVFSPENEIRNIMAPVGGKVISSFSDSPIYFEITGDWRTHEAIDFSAKEGSDVYAADKGKIIKITDGGVNGAEIIIDHENTMKTIYSNVKAENIKVGDFVNKGEIIGTAQNFSLIESYPECHIHFEVLINDKNVNPEEYIK